MRHEMLKRLIATARAVYRGAYAPGIDGIPPEPETPEALALQSMGVEHALQRTARRGLSIGTVIDVGASDGRWSEACKLYVPQARYLLIEAQAIHEPALKRYCATHPNAQFIVAAAADQVGAELYFDDSDPFGGQAHRQRSASATNRVPVTTIDHEVLQRGLDGPYLIKLDTHGFEVPILRGAERALQNAELLIIEAYNFRIAPEALLFHELIAYLDQRGFRVVDLSEPLWRAKDGAFWQIDIFFQRSDRREFSDHGYS
jgi:FkbM family methyltransferase